MDGRLPSWRTFRPEIARLWLRRSFREWPGASERRWIDLATGRLRRSGEDVPLPAADTIDAGGGLLYIPPVDRELAPARDELVGTLARRGVPLLVQVAPEDSRSISAAAPEAIVVDLLDALLSRRLEALDSTPRGAVALWPLLPALTDDPALWREGCDRLASAGVSCVQALVPELSPSDRRELADSEEAAVARGEVGGEVEGVAFSRLFHGRSGDERRFAAAAAARGLDVFFRRATASSDRRSRNAALAEMLALGAELWLRLDRGEVQGQELFRASRWVEDTTVDVRALAAEGNLEIVEALRRPASEIVAEWASTGRSAMVESWLAEYVTPPLSASSG